MTPRHCGIRNVPGGKIRCIFVEPKNPVHAAADPFRLLFGSPNNDSHMSPELVRAQRLNERTVRVLLG